MTEQKPWTGKKVAMIFFAPFIVIIGVNIALAVNAVSSFPGLEVENSYIASQDFDRLRIAQEKLGWSVIPSYSDGVLTVILADKAGAPVTPREFSVMVGRTTVRDHDQNPQMTFDGHAYVAPLALERGKWELRIKAVAEDGTEFKQRLTMNIRG